MLENAHFLFSFEFSFVLHLLQGSKAAAKMEADSTTNKIEKIKENAGSSEVETVRKKIASLVNPIFPCSFMYCSMVEQKNMVYLYTSCLCIC